MTSLLNRLSERLRGVEEQMGNEIACFSQDGRILVISDHGDKPDRNDDCAGFHVENDETLLALADGVGSGGIASRSAARISVQSLLDPKKTFAQGAKQAHQAIQALPGAEGKRNVAAVVAAARIKGDRLKKVHLGDSRVYHVRSRSVVDQTVDHVAPHHVRSVFMPVSAISADPHEDLSRFDAPTEHELKEGDWVLMLSDGLHHGGIDVEAQVIGEIEKLITTYGASDAPEQLAGRILAHLRTVAELSEDNISLVLYSHKKPLIPVKKTVSERMSEGVRKTSSSISERIGKVDPRAKWGLAALAAAGLATTAASYWPEEEPAPEPKDVYKEVCKNSMPGTWTLANGKPFKKKGDLMNSFAGKTVDIEVVNKNNKTLVALEDFPGDCLQGGKAPRAIAATFPNANDRVLIQDGPVKTPFYFTPGTPASNALQNPAPKQTGDLVVSDDGTTWMRCSAPVNLGCANDAEAIRRAF